MSPVERRVAERELKGIRDRLVVNYSPLVKHVAGGVTARMSGAVD
jgi:DNA-directed RNA polymerase specialized sigma subunit